MKKVNQGIFRAYDLRGVVDTDFDPEWVEMFGRACGTFFLQKGYIQAVVGHDCRHSSPEYQRSLVRGMVKTGLDVVFLDMVPTPVFYYAVKKLGRKAGVMITASHNPPEFNGFKVWAGDSTIHTREIERLYEITKSGNFIRGHGLASQVDIVPTYLEDLSSQIRLNRPVRIVVDGGNGSAGEVCAELLRCSGVDVIPLYTEPDGSFPNHHPDPTVEDNIGDLKELTIRKGADFGIGLDGDGDRIGVVDEKGRILYGDKLLAVFARQVLSGHPGSTIIGEVKCSHLLFQDIENHGGKPLMYKTGHSLIKAKMKDTGALLAGEMSGHMFFADRYYGFDDASYAALRLAEIVDNADRPVSRFLEEWPQTFNTPEIRLECPDSIKFQVVEKALAFFKTKYQVIDVDGVRILFDDGWGLVRGSNTQPVLVLRFEAESKSRLKEIRSLVEKPLTTWIEGLRSAS
ncbi:MAG: phosphomannomutase/phosphoglucomutase [Desulfovibrionales bacterium]